MNSGGFHGQQVLVFHWMTMARAIMRYRLQNSAAVFWLLKVNCIIQHTYISFGNASLTVTPRDTEAVVGASAFLNCSTSLDKDVHWYHGLEHVYAGEKFLSPYNERLKIDENKLTGMFNLVFPSVIPEDAGVYSCRENEGREKPYSANLIVLNKDGLYQSNMKPDGVVGPNDCNIDPEEVLLSCRVTYNGSTPPQMKWKKFNTSEQIDTTCISSNGRTTCNVTIKGDLSLINSSYVCQTTRASGEQHTVCSSGFINVIYAFNYKSAIDVSLNTELECNPNTSQNCRYKWKHSDKIVSESAMIIPINPGLHQCEAECNIRDKQCSIVQFYYVNAVSTAATSSSSSNAALVVVVVVLIIVCASIAVAWFICARRSKKKNKFKNNEYREQLLRASADKEENENLKKSKEKLEKELENKEKYLETPQEEIVQLRRSKAQRLSSYLDRDRKNKPKCIRTLIPEASKPDKGAQGIQGLAILGEELFVLSNEYPEIEVFADLKKLESTRKIVMEGHKLERPWDIASCSQNNCLYVVDRKFNTSNPAEIVRVDPNGNLLKKWSTGCTTGRLSITTEANVIFTGLFEAKIHEYDSDGKLISDLSMLSGDGLCNPFMSVRVEDYYLVCHGNRGDSKHRVCKIDNQGEVQLEFGRKKGSDRNQLLVPAYMTVDDNDLVFVADRENSRIILLRQSNLQLVKILLWYEDRLRYPNRVCLDRQSLLLFIADNTWKTDSIPWHDGKVLVFDISSLY